ncbi:MAG: hypothetical protein AAFU61_08825 [Pseudomonadota bacterium]
MIDHSPAGALRSPDQTLGRPLRSCAVAGRFASWRAAACAAALLLAAPAFAARPAPFHAPLDAAAPGAAQDPLTLARCAAQDVMAETLGLIDVETEGRGAPQERALHAFAHFAARAFAEAGAQDPEAAARAARDAAVDRYAAGHLNDPGLIAADRAPCRRIMRLRLAL